MTSRRWLVERDELDVGDLFATPFPQPTEASIKEAVSLFELVFRNGGKAALVDEFAYRQYGLRPYEIPLIADAIDCVYDYYSKKGKSSSLKPPSAEMLVEYVKALKEVLRNSLGQAGEISCCVYYGQAPLLIAVLNMTVSAKREPVVHCSNQEMNSFLESLDKQLVESRSGSVFVKRNARIYSKDRICIIKPNQMRYWSYSAACRDADELYADVMRAWRNEDE